MFYRVVILLIVAVCCFSCNETLKEKTLSEEEQYVLPDSVNYNEHISLILFSKCATCHRPGQAGPFPLLTFDDAFKRKKTILKVTHSGYMPPWPADRSYSSFAGELFLTEKEKALIRRWVETGATEGDIDKTPEVPVFPEGSQLGKPDLVLKFPRPYKLKGDNTDQYVLMKIPYEIPADRYVRAIEYVPGNRRRVHHVNGYMVVYDDNKKSDHFKGDYFVNNYEVPLPDAWKMMNLLNDDGSYPLRIPSVANYLPGVVPSLYPEGVGGFLMKKKGALILNDIHYGPSPKEETDESYFNIFFSEKAPERVFGEFQLGTYGVSEIVPRLMVPPDSIKTFYTKYTIQDDISLLTVNPHMHLLGKKFLAYAVNPKGDTIPLIRINRWDFRWQYFYTFKKMLKLPKGTVIYVEATFDNTSSNPHNPFSPPQWVGDKNGSMSTKDEMLQFIVTYLSYREGDENISLEGSSFKKTE